MAIILIPMYKTHGLDNDSNIVLFMSMAAYGIARSIKDKGDFRDREKRFVGIINSTGKETSWERLIIRRVPGGYSVIQMHMHLYKNTVIKDEEVAYFVKWRLKPRNKRLKGTKAKKKAKSKRKTPE